MSELCCWNCGASLADVPRPISRHANCSKCFEVLHCCRLCRWYAPGRPLDCDHDRADPPVEKETANFCEYFSPRLNAFKPVLDEQKIVAKAKLADLFGAGDAESASIDEVDSALDKARSKLNDLFND